VKVSAKVLSQKVKSPNVYFIIIIIIII